MESDATDDISDYGSDDYSSNSTGSGEDIEVETWNQGNVSGSGEIRGSSNRANNIREITADDFVNREFNSYEEAYELYVKYARCVGFGVRKSDVARDDEGNFIRRSFVCNRAGLRDKKYYESVNRKRDHKPETRTNCKAKLCVYFDRSSISWKVSKLDEEHNHDLIPLAFVHLIQNHRRMTEADKAQVDSMHRHGIATSQIMGFLAGQAGGFEGIGFSRKDLYNYIDRERHGRINDGDANAAIGYLQGKADSEPMTLARYSSTADGRLANLFWADGLSRVDYQYFGDVVAFDSTYKKNKYNKPLVIFSGSNHHRLTCIFGFALLVDESAETYKWLLKQFLDVMMGKEPSVVVTDGDNAMRKAIKAYFPNATHRLCSWHLEKNCWSNIKQSDFCDAFKQCIYGNFECDEFEEHWNDMVEKYQLEENRWVQKAYKRKEMWANAYLRDKFCAGFRTTSRCEGINAFVAKFIQSKDSILELVQNLERALSAYRNNELGAQFNSIYGEPVLTTGLDSIERAAANVYTREVFKDVKKEMVGASSLFVGSWEPIGTTVVYKVCRYGKPSCQYTVMFDRNLDQYECKCRMWNGFGIVCSHMFCVMRHEQIEAIPECLILKRWCKNAKTYGHEEVNEDEDDSEKIRLLRYGALCAASQWMSFLGSKRLVNFRETMDEITRISTDLEHKCGLDERPSMPRNGKKVADPAVVKSKGAPPGAKVSKKRRCSNCLLGGHTKRNCPIVKGPKSVRCEDNCSFPIATDDELDLNCDVNIEANGDVVESSAAKKQVNKDEEPEKCHRTGAEGQESQPADSTKFFFAGPQINQFYPPQFYPMYTHSMAGNGVNSAAPSIPAQGAGQMFSNVFGGVEFSGCFQPQYVGDPGNQWLLQALQQRQKQDGETIEKGGED